MEDINYEKIENICNNKISALLKQKDIFGAIEKKSEKILTSDLSNKMTIFDGGTQNISHIEIQNYLFKKLQRFLNSLDKDVNVLLENADVYPSGCIIKYSNFKIIYFDFYEHIFKDVHEFSLDYYNSEMVKLKEGMVVSLEELKKVQQKIQQPLNKDIFSKIHYKIFKDRIIRQLREEEKHLKMAIEVQEKCIAQIKEEIKEYQSVKDTIQEKFEFWSDQFKTVYGYKGSN